MVARLGFAISGTATSAFASSPYTNLGKDVFVVPPSIGDATDKQITLVDRFLEYVVEIDHVKDIDEADFEEALGVTLAPGGDEGHPISGSGEPGQAFDLGAEYIPPLDAGPELRLRLCGHDAYATQAPICGPTVEKVRDALGTTGYKEATRRVMLKDDAEAWLLPVFRKNDIEIIVYPRWDAATSEGTCLWEIAVS